MKGEEEQGEMRGFDELTEATDLIEEQELLAALTPAPWHPAAGPIVVAGAFVAFARGQQGPGRAGDRAHVGAAATCDTIEVARTVVEAHAGAPYAPGLLAAREGAPLATALGALFDRGVRPDVLLVDATGRDHPRRAGLALHLGAMLGLPSVGVTHRPLRASGPEPGDEEGAWTDLVVDDEVVGRWLRTRPGVRPLAIHAAWRTDSETAAAVVRRVVARARTPEPLRLARCAAREARAAAQRRGHRALPHTADLFLEGWGGDRAACFEELVSAVVETCADVSRAAASGRHEFVLADAPGDRMLLALLDEVIFLIDTGDAMPVSARIAPTPDGDLSVSLALADRAMIEAVGPVPKAVARSALTFVEGDQGVRCSVLVDV